MPLRRPDGDVELVDAGVGFNLAACDGCGSQLMKPDVVFFGDSVPKDRVDRWVVCGMERAFGKKLRKQYLVRHMIITPGPAAFGDVDMGW